MAPGGQCGGKCEFRVDQSCAIERLECSFVRRLRQCRCITKRPHREVIGGPIMCGLAVGARCLSPTQPDRQCAGDTFDDAALQGHLVFGLAFKCVAPEVTLCRYLEQPHGHLNTTIEGMHATTNGVLRTTRRGEMGPCGGRDVAL